MRKIIFITIVAFLSTFCANAQGTDTTSVHKETLPFGKPCGDAHSIPKIEHSINVGVGIGASSPIPIPNRISEMSWAPHPCGILGYRLRYTLNSNLGLKTGLQLQHVGMSAKAKVYQMFTQATVEDAEVSGYFTGYNETKINATYLSVPLLFSYKIIGTDWGFDAGVFVALKIQGHFGGAVKDGYIRIDTPTGDRAEVGYETFNFSKELNPFNFGLLFSAEREISQHWSGWLDLSWALTPTLKDTFQGLEYKMYNIYGFFGISYNL